MNNKDNVFDLVKSLNRHEKRFFKRYVKLHNPNKLPQYLYLFEVLDKMERFEKAQIVAELSKVAVDSGFNQLKQYLKYNIFKALKVYDKKGTYEIQDNEDLNTAKILIVKKLYTMAEKILLKLRKNAIAQENSQLHILANKQLVNIKNLGDKNDIKVNGQIEQYYEESMFCNKELLEKTELQQINVKASKFYHSRERLNKKFNNALIKILEKDLAPFKTEKFLSKDNALIYYNLIFTLNSILHKYKDAFVAIENARKIIQSVVLRFYSKRVATLYVNILYSYVYNEKTELFFPMLRKAQLFLDKIPKLKPTHQHMLYLRELEFYISVVEEKPGKQVLEKIKTYIKNTSTNMPFNYKNLLLNKIADCYFKAHEYANCQDVLLTITLEGDVPLDATYFFQVNFKEVICYYELGTLKIAKQKLEMLERRLNKSKIETKNIIAMVGAVKSIITSKKEKLEYFEQLKDFFPKNDGIIIVDNNLAALWGWVMHKMEVLKQG